MPHGAPDPAPRIAETAQDYRAFGDICRAYVDWCRARYADMPWFVEEVFSHQALDAELEGLASKYSPPNGRTLLMEDGQGLLGAGAYRRLSERICELKRLHVVDRGRGLGIGRRLSKALIAAARLDGFTTMLLDTGDRMTEAQALYRTMGFEVVGPYQPYPQRLAQHLVFMRKGL